MPAAKRQVDAALVICLALSTLAPCQAFRMVGNHHQDDSMNAEKWWWISCPKGLTLNTTTRLCSYPDKGGKSTALFKNISKAKLLFNQTSGGTYLTNAQYISELATAYSDWSAMYHVGNSLAEVEIKRNATFKQLVSQQNATEASKLFQLEEKLIPGFFLVNLTVKDNLVEGLATGLEALATAVEGGGVVGEAVGALAAGAAGIAGFVTEWVFPILLPLEIAKVITDTLAFFKARTHSAKDFSSHLVLKSDCMITQLKKITTSMAVRPIVGEVCGPQFQSDLENQLRAANSAKLELYNTLASLGRCSYPRGARAWSKTNCVETMYFKLLQSGGQSGILYNSLAFMAYYGFRLDELMEEPFFGAWYETEFGIQKHSATVSLVPQLTATRDLDVGQKWPVCMQLIATHRAFERTFQRLNVAIKVWMRSFARDLRGISLRDTWWPCQKVFYKIWDDSQEGFCKSFDWKIGHGLNEKPIDESMACKQGKQFQGSLWPETQPSTQSTTTLPAR